MLRAGPEPGRLTMMLEGAMVPLFGVGVLATLWVIVLYGSSFFGPR
jgi:hypothetical protein